MDPAVERYDLADMRRAQFIAMVRSFHLTAKPDVAGERRDFKDKSDHYPPPGSLRVASGWLRGAYRLATRWPEGGLGVARDAIPPVPPETAKNRIRQVLPGSQSRRCPEAHRRGQRLQSEARNAKNAPESAICGVLPYRPAPTGCVLWLVPISNPRKRASQGRPDQSMV